MPRTPAPIPSITAVQRELTADDVRTIIRLAEAEEARRSEQIDRLRAALESGDGDRVVQIARELCGLVEAEPPAAA
jgi:hypothetical protein